MIYILWIFLDSYQVCCLGSFLREAMNPPPSNSFFQTHLFLPFHEMSLIHKLKTWYPRISFNWSRSVHSVKVLCVGLCHCIACQRFKKIYIETWFLKYLFCNLWLSYDVIWIWQHLLCQYGLTKPTNKHWNQTIIQSSHLLKFRLSSLIWNGYCCSSANAFKGTLRLNRNSYKYIALTQIQIYGFSSNLICRMYLMYLKQVLKFSSHMLTAAKKQNCTNLSPYCHAYSYISNLQCIDGLWLARWLDG